MQPDSTGRRWIQLLIGIVISVGLIWLAFRNTPFSDVWGHITAMKPIPMVLAVILATLPFALRVPRWSLLLRKPDGTSIRPRSLWHATAIGFAANNTLPFRLGEIARMGAISRLGPVPFPSALASIAVERVLDALAAVALLAVALLLVDLPDAADVGHQATMMGLVAALALIAAIVVARWPVLALRPIEAVVPAGRVRTLFTSIIERLVAGLSALRDPRRAVPIVLWSLLIWTVNAAAFWVAFKAFNIEVPFAGAFILQGALLVGIAIPSTPGYAGVFETAIWFTLLHLFGVPRDLGLAYAIAYHVLTFVPITILGVASLLSTGFSLKATTERVA